MIQQQVLFDLLESPKAPEPEPLPPHNGTPTSREAAESIRDHVSRLRQTVFDAIRSAGDRGMTCDEVEVETGLSHQTASARVCELANPPKKATWPALIRDGGTKRPTRSGRKAVAWVAAEFAKNP